MRLRLPEKMLRQLSFEPISSSLKRRKRVFLRPSLGPCREITKYI
jgi:hypothetical protein